MIHHKSFYRFVILVPVLLVFAACKSVAVLPTKKPIKKVDISALASKIKENYPKVNKVRSRIRAVYNDGKRQQQVIVQLRIEAQKTIWMSASMVIPIAKLLITQEGVSFYEKFQKNYFKGNFDLINDPFKTTFSYEDVERLLLGKPFLDLNAGKWKQISNPQYYILIPQGSKSGFQPTLFFDPTTFLLKEQRFLIPGGTQNLTVKYINHQRIQGEYLPQQIEISLAGGEQNQSILLEFTKTDLPGTLSFPFDIPEGYKQISF